MWKKIKKFFGYVEKPPYIPQGRMGYCREYSTVCGSTHFHYIVAVEELQQIGDRSRVKILDVNVYRDCRKSKSQCLKDYGMSDWINRSLFEWETNEQWEDRLNITQRQGIDIPRIQLTYNFANN